MDFAAPATTALWQAQRRQHVQAYVPQDTTVSHRRCALLLLVMVSALPATTALWQARRRQCALANALQDILACRQQCVHQQRVMGRARLGTIVHSGALPRPKPSVLLVVIAPSVPVRPLYVHV